MSSFITGSQLMRDIILPEMKLIKPLANKVVFGAGYKPTMTLILQFISLKINHYPIFNGLLIM